MSETKTTDTADLTGPGQLYAADRGYVAVTLTDDLRAAIYAKVRELIAAGTDTTPGLLLRDIVARDLGVTVNVTRAPNGAAKTDAEKRDARIHTMAHTAGLLAQHGYDKANPDGATNAPERVASYQKAYVAKAAALRAADAKKAALAALDADAADSDNGILPENPTA